MPRGTKRAASTAADAQEKKVKRGKKEEAPKEAPAKGKGKAAAKEEHGSENPANGSICHFEIPVKDFARAKKFYSNVFQWTYQDFGPTYVFCMFGGETKETMSKMPHCGLIPAEDNKIPKESGVLVHLTCASIDEGVKKVLAAGGKLVKPKWEIGGGHGCNALVKDSEGNTFALWAMK